MAGVTRRTAEDRLEAEQSRLEAAVVEAACDLYHAIGASREEQAEIEERTGERVDVINQWIALRKAVTALEEHTGENNS